jgi:hypothetical protein
MTKTSERRSERPILIMQPLGSGTPTPQIDANTSFVIVEDSDVGRDMMELDGDGGPAAFDVLLTEILTKANKVIVAVGGPGELLRLMMLSAARPAGYSVVIDTPLSRFSSWAEEAVNVRGNQRGLALLGPRSGVPPELRDRCAGDPTVEPMLGVQDDHAAIH